MGNDEFLLVKERHLKCQVKHMSWSPKRDLIAIATDGGDLLLYRLSSLERVWSLPPRDKDSSINCLCWRPDGSVVAVGYNTKESGVRLVYMEKSQIIWHLSEERSLLQSPATILKWFETDIQNREFYVKQFASLSFKDYIADLPKLHSKDVVNIDIKRVVGSTKFHVLMICDERNTLTLYAYGIFPLLSVPSTSFQFPLNSVFKVSDISLSSDFKFICAALSTNEKKSTSCDIQLFDISNTMRDLEVCEMVAKKACHVTAVMTYIENVLDLMNESCETVVQEMESKLTKYLINKTMTGTIGDEFMHFLLWGKPSDVLQDLLMHCMTQKSVMKLGTLVEASYTSIQQLLLVNFQLAVDALYYHLNELKGMSTPTILGNLQLLDQKQVSEVLQCSGSFILKANEMQQVIGQSLKNFKAFFRWLYSTIVKIHGESMDESPPVQMSVKELEFVADFVSESFIHEHEQLKLSGRERHFNVDKVYQYLQASPLTSPQSMGDNDWFRLVDSTQSLSNNPCIIKRRTEASLRQLYLELKNLLKNLLNCSSAIISGDSTVQRSRILSAPSSFQPHSCYWFVSEPKSCFYALTASSTLPCTELVLSEINVDCRTSKNMRLNFVPPGGDGEQYVINDYTYYSDQFITMLIKQGTSTLLVQVSLPPLLEDLKKNGGTSPHSCDATAFVTHQCVTDPMSPVHVASSGTRKVSCVVDSGGRHIRAYDMDQTNDDDDDDDFDNSMTTS